MGHKKQLEVRLLPNGEIKIETHNIKGKQCLQYMELFSELLHAQIVDSSFTEEYYEQEELAACNTENEVMAE